MKVVCCRRVCLDLAPTLISHKAMLLQQVCEDSMKKRVGRCCSVSPHGRCMLVSPKTCSRCASTHTFQEL